MASARSQILREISESFPCLRGGMIAHCFHNGEFKPSVLGEDLRSWSHGEQQACRFLLTLWCSSSTAKRRGWLFNPLEALTVWDMGNRAAYVAWCRAPIYP
jgi:hypothetical protein